MCINAVKKTRKIEFKTKNNKDSANNWECQKLKEGKCRSRENLAREARSHFATQVTFNFPRANLNEPILKRQPAITSKDSSKITPAKRSHETPTHKAIKNFLLESLSREASDARTLDNILEGGRQQLLTDRPRVSAASTRVIVRKRQHILKDLRRTCSLASCSRAAPFKSESQNVETTKEKSVMYLRDHETQ